jgi:hypothetical protein
VGLSQVVTRSWATPGRRRRPALVLIGVIPLLLAACSSASASGSASSTTKPSGTASRTAYTACLKQHGVTLPSFTGGGGRPGANAAGGTRPAFTPGSGSFPGGGRGGFANNPKFQKATAACKSLRPAGGFGGFGRGGGAGGFNSTAFAAYRNCLKLHGVTLPTGRPAKPASGAGSTPSTTFNQTSPTVQAALAACAALRPSATSTTTTTPA